MALRLHDYRGRRCLLGVCTQFVHTQTLTSNPMASAVNVEAVIEDLHPLDDHSHKFFIWPEWIAALSEPLTAETAFEYFTTSMFYDKQSNNQVLRMQTMHTGTSIANEAEELKRFTGLEFALVHAEPPSFFIIHKRERVSPEEVRPLAAYFIVNNRIYQSPDIYSVLSNRLLTAVHSLQSSLDILRSYRPDYTPRTGFAWPIVEDAKSVGGGSVRTDDVRNERTDGERQRRSKPGPDAPRKRENLTFLLNAMQTTAVHSNASFAQRAEEALAGEATSESATGSTASPSVRIGTPGALSSNPSVLEGPSKAAQTKKKKKKATSFAMP
ncbi:MED6-domain-containing protein [Sistotremastrum niveocremeum HHB9708]|uniref:Mediator of RNA polymerase II transcription subunit 6 n=1 Tax=Sistotremastrum niveocremeum HHB9708 TaxID=1314777 RepID=A0A164UBD6_9AGAM|nr:MED6-domain-containing protein [Sistotremastrum niveocremeum HHB9708]